MFLLLLLREREPYQEYLLNSIDKRVQPQLMQVDNIHLQNFTYKNPLYEC